VLAVHLRPIDVQVGRVVVEEQVGDHIEIVHVCRQWIVVGFTTATLFFIEGVAVRVANAFLARSKLSGGF
jgi:hypothetical protein